MAKYTGRRIVPKHAGEWDIRKEYEELQIVLDTDSGNSFISNLPVPKGTALDDEKYWSLFSLHSEQIAEAEEHLTQTAEDIRSELSETENRISKNVSDTEGRINESLSSTESKVNTSLSETESRVTARVENAKSDLTAKVAAAEQQMNQNAQNVAQTNKALNARMDQIAKGRTSDTEVLDARVDSEGNTFDNLGAAIRSIYPKAKEGLDALQESKVDANYDATGELTEGITVNTINAESAEPPFTTEPCRQERRTLRMTGVWMPAAVSCWHRAVRRTITMSGIITLIPFGGAQVLRIPHRPTMGHLWEKQTRMLPGIRFILAKEMQSALPILCMRRRSSRASWKCCTPSSETMKKTGRTHGSIRNSGWSTRRCRSTSQNGILPEKQNWMSRFCSWRKKWLRCRGG